MKCSKSNDWCIFSDEKYRSVYAWGPLSDVQGLCNDTPHTDLSTAVSQLHILTTLASGEKTLYTGGWVDWVV